MSKAQTTITVQFSVDDVHVDPDYADRVHGEIERLEGNSECGLVMDRIDITRPNPTIEQMKIARGELAIRIAELDMLIGDC